MGFKCNGLGCKFVCRKKKEIDLHLTECILLRYQMSNIIGDKIIDYYSPNEHKSNNRFKIFMGSERDVFRKIPEEYMYMSRAYEWLNRDMGSRSFLKKKMYIQIYPEKKCWDSYSIYISENDPEDMTTENADLFGYIGKLYKQHDGSAALQLKRHMEYMPDHLSDKKIITKQLWSDIMSRHWYIQDAVQKEIDEQINQRGFAIKLPKSYDQFHPNVHASEIQTKIGSIKKTFKNISYTDSGYSTPKLVYNYVKRMYVIYSAIVNKYIYDFISVPALNDIIAAYLIGSKPLH
ncbi:MAG: hypothetical protein Hyperionvirus24_27 [Hyperionvirus sp.]|uniref:Uncharacterized protein n=1 Tax=Hyperionvirus sp. TaxID=2487770 RepID=A0A3G5AAY5_9VIRU|nr:MAG: hypothetical protein Hyperionvirus24_27 [Hyperionvirus sp.]